MIYVVVDGGQTKTEVTVKDKNNEVRSWLESPILHPASTAGMNRLTEIVVSVLTKLSSICDEENSLKLAFSLSGFHGEEFIEAHIKQLVDAFSLRVTNTLVIPDYVGNWLSVTDGSPGIVILSGGGTIAYGENERGEKCRLGGWGHLLGDEGSGYWFGLQTIKAALRSMNGLSNYTLLQEVVKKYFQVNGEFELTHVLNSGRISDQEIALLLPELDRVAMSGDLVAEEIVRSGVTLLVELGVKMTEKLGNVPIYTSGGVFRATSIKQEFLSQFQEKNLSIQNDVIVKPGDGVLRYMGG
ncbi:BadF/BadG/BcrA/BcrD ATPase family protein [Neobacillus sp.]|uniref:BadF/BadG/BcrA/BcrD ATPase family protein n=1 Tax=Neobacillus sp. TaxID=2675273 RepID=UPI00289E3D2D|nr:BadF/BadG/BcrA/BcrD ATPase family protein [Neobacillus sp.]